MEDGQMQAVWEMGVEVKRGRGRKTASQKCYNCLDWTTQAKRMTGDRKEWSKFTEQ